MHKADLQQLLMTSTTIKSICIENKVIIYNLHQIVCQWSISSCRFPVIGKSALSKHVLVHQSFCNKIDIRYTTCQSKNKQTKRHRQAINVHFICQCFWRDQAVATCCWFQIMFTIRTYGSRI